MSIAVIGFGEIGQSVSDALIKSPHAPKPIIVADVDDQKLKDRGLDDPHSYKLFYERPYHILDRKDGDPPILPWADVYIVTVWDSNQVNNVLRGIAALRDAGKLPTLKLVSIETTTVPGEVVIPEALRPFVVFFPHRFNPDDEEHAVFNINRVMGSDNGEALARGILFFYPYMTEGASIWPAPARVAQLSKLVENSYRYMEIVLAQELKKAVESRFPGDWERVREACNTKWNIDILEARDGVGGKCLPKDIDLLKVALGRINLTNDDIFAFMQWKNHKYTEGQK